MCLCISSGAQASSICNRASSVYVSSNCIETEFTKDVDKISGIITGISKNDEENINKGTNNNNIITYLRNRMVIH